MGPERVPELLWETTEGHIAIEAVGAGQAASAVRSVSACPQSSCFLQAPDDRDSLRHRALFFLLLLGDVLGYMAAAIEKSRDWV